MKEFRGLDGSKRGGVRCSILGAPLCVSPLPARRSRSNPLPPSPLSQPRVFGWTPNNEISNGRWVMFGLLVGMLTEYATGVSFVDQLGLMASYLGVADLD